MGIKNASFKVFYDTNGDGKWEKGERTIYKGDLENSKIKNGQVLWKLGIIRFNVGDGNIGVEVNSVFSDNSYMHAFSLIENLMND